MCTRWGLVGYTMCTRWGLVGYRGAELTCWVHDSAGLVPSLVIAEPGGSGGVSGGIRIAAPWVIAGGEIASVRALMLGEVADNDPSVAAFDHAFGLNLVQQIGHAHIVGRQDAQLELARFVLQVSVVAGVAPHPLEQQSCQWGDGDNVLVCEERRLECSDFRH